MSSHSCRIWWCTHSICSKRVKHSRIHCRIHSSCARRLKIFRRLRIKSYHAECHASAFLDTNRRGWQGEVSPSFLYHNFSVCKMCHVSVRLSRLERLIEGQSFAVAWRVRRIFWSLFWLILTIWFDSFEKQICKYERFSYSVSPDEKKKKVHDIKREVQRDKIERICLLPFLKSFHTNYAASSPDGVS